MSRPGSAKPAGIGEKCCVRSQDIRLPAVMGVFAMPAKVTKVKGGYSVKTPNATHVKRTTAAKAKSQQRLLNAIDHGWTPTRNKKK